MNCLSTARFRAVKLFVCGLTFLCLASLVALAAGALSRYHGQVLYRASKGPVAGVLVEVVEAENNGAPTDEVLGSARADAEGRFSIALTEPTNKPVTLVVSAVRETAETGGDKSESGIDVKSHRTELGFLPFASAAKSNTVYIERRQPGRPNRN